MNKAEQFFNTVDFSVETDFKERLRKQLFDNIERSFSEQNLKYNSADIHNTQKKRKSARELSIDELEMVNAAGNISMQEKALRNRVKSKPIQDRPDQNPWNTPFSGNIANHDDN